VGNGQHVTCRKEGLREWYLRFKQKNRNDSKETGELGAMTADQCRQTEKMIAKSKPGRS